jgi:hypothetical protein
MQDPEITSFNTLQPAVVRTIREAFDEAVKELEQRRASSLPEDARAKLARRLVDLAKHGECNFDKLRKAALSVIPV